MGERRNSDPRSDRHRLIDPRLNPNYVKPLPSDKSSNSRQKPNPIGHDSRTSTNEKSNTKVAERRSSSHEMHVSTHSDYSESTPPRYSPPPSLKPYTIPRRAGQKTLLKATSLDSREGIFVTDTIKQSLWNPDTIVFEFTKLEVVNNERLEAEYITKRKEMKEGNRSTTEISDCFVFLYLRSKEECREICQNGLTCKKQYHIPTGASCSLGDKKYGVYLCRCADAVTRKTPLNQYGKENIMLICKIMKGRVKIIQDHADQKSDAENTLEPTPEFDSHVSRRFQRGKKMNYDFIYDASQVYLYEIDLEKFSLEDDAAIFAKRPRHCLPYAVVYFKSKQNVPSAIEQMKVPTKEPTLGSTCVANGVGQTNADLPSGTEQTYDECMKNMRYVWKGLYFRKTQFLTEIQIGVFSKKDLWIPLDTPNLSIQQKISWERLSKILPAKIYRKPPCKSLQPETDVVGIKFLHAEIHPVDQSTDTVVQKLQNNWLKTKMAGVCTLSSGYKLFILPSSVFTDKLGVTDLFYPAILHCIFMKESTETNSMKGPQYDNFILRQQLALHSRLCENENLKDSNTDVNACVQRKYAYTLTERQTIAKFISQIKRSQEKRETSKHMDLIKKTYQNTFTHSTNVTSTYSTDNSNKVTLVHSSNDMVPISVSMNNPSISRNVNTQTSTSSTSNHLITTLPTAVTVAYAVAASTLTSPTSSDSLSGTELCPDEQQPAIDFCLSFKREGSARTERVKLFPSESLKKADLPMHVDIVQSDDSPSSSEVPLVSTPDVDIETTNASSQIKDDLPMLDSTAKDHEDLKGSPKDNGNTTDSSQDSEDNLVINLDDNVDAEDNDNDIVDVVSDIKQPKKCDNIKSCKESIGNVIARNNAVLDGSINNISINDVAFDDNSETDNCSKEITNVHSFPTKLKPKKPYLDKSTQNLFSQISLNCAPLLTSSSQFSSLQTPKLSSSRSQSPCTVSQKPSSSLQTSNSNFHSSSSKFESSQSSQSTFSQSTSSQSSSSQSSSSQSSSSQSSSSQSSSSQSSSQMSNSQTPIPNTCSDNYTAVNIIKDTIDIPENSLVSLGKNGDDIQDNYDNVTMDEGSEDSQEAINISSDHIEIEDMECEDVDETKVAKCSSPSLTQLNYAKEKILMQLSMMQTEEKRKLNARLSLVQHTESSTPKYDSGSESGSDSQESVVIPFLGEDNESEEDTTSEDAPGSPYEDPVVNKATEKVDKRFWAEGLNLEKAAMAILAIGSEYYEQVSPAVSDPPSLKVSPVPPLPNDKEKSPPPPPPPERPVGKVIPVTTTISFGANLQDSHIMPVSVSSIAKVSAVATLTTACLTASPICSIPSLESNVLPVPTSSTKSSNSQIPFLSDDPNDKILTIRTSPSVNPKQSPFLTVSSQPSELLVDPYRPPPAPPLDPYRPPPAPPLDPYRPSPPPLISDSMIKVPAVYSTTSNSNMGHSPTPPKRPIMEVSPVVRSSSGPWLSNHPNRGIPPLISSGNQTHIPFRSIDRSMCKSTLAPPFRDISSLTGQDAFGVNREEADAMFHNRDAAQERGIGSMGQEHTAMRLKHSLRDNSELSSFSVHHTGNKCALDPVKDKMIIPRAYRHPASPHPISRPHSPEDDSSLITPRAYRHSPSSPNSDWERRSLSNKHRSKRRSRSRSPYLRNRYHRSRSPTRKGSRDRSPRYVDSEGDWEKSNFRRVYGSDIDVYKEERSERLERLERLDRLERRPERPDRVERPGRSPLYASPGPYDSRWEAKEAYSKNDPKESLDEFLIRSHTSNSNLIRPRSSDEDSHRPRRNSYSSEERPSSLPVAPADDSHSSGKNNKKSLAETEDSRIRERWDEPQEDRFRGDRCISRKSISKKWIEEYWL